MGAQLFNKATSRTLRAKVVDMIRDAIVSGKLKPGEHLKETVLAEQFSKINKEVNARVAGECVQIVRLINAEQDS